MSEGVVSALARGGDGGRRASLVSRSAGASEKWRGAPGAAGEAPAPPTAPVDGPAQPGRGTRGPCPTMSLLSVTGSVVQ